MVRFHAYTGFQSPGLHIWREGTDFKVSVKPVAGLAADEPGWVEFEYDLDPAFTPRVRFMLFDHDERGRPSRWEKAEHQRTLQRRDGTFSDAWFAQDASRVLTADPRAEQREWLRFHLITRQKYRPSQLFIWDHVTDEKRRLDSNDADELGPIWDVSLDDWNRSFFCFKFIARDNAGQFKVYEPDVANRLYVTGDGGEIWIHSETAQIYRSRPERKQLLINFRQGLSALNLPLLRFWPSNAEWSEDAPPPPAPDADGWLAYNLSIYTGLRFGLQFHWEETDAEVWEHPEAKRFVSISGDEERGHWRGTPHCSTRRHICSV